MIMLGSHSQLRHRIWCHFQYPLFGLTIVIMAVLFAGPSIAREAAGAEWVLQQNHLDRGALTVYVSRDAVKITSQRYGYEILAKAPTWTVYCFRPKEKVVWFGPMEHFSGVMLTNPTGVAGRNRMTLSSAGKGSINGIKYSRYNSPNKTDDYQLCADDIVISKGGSEFCSRYYELPDVGKVPIYLTVNKGQGCDKPMNEKGQWLGKDFGGDLRAGKLIELVTQSCKKIPYNAADFARPVGYTRLGALTRVSYSPELKESFTEVMGAVGFTSGYDDKHKEQAPSSPKREGAAK